MVSTETRPEEIIEGVARILSHNKRAEVKEGFAQLLAEFKVDVFNQAMNKGYPITFAQVNEIGIKALRTLFKDVIEEVLEEDRNKHSENKVEFKIKNKIEE